MKNENVELAQEQSVWSRGVLERLSACPCCGHAASPPPPVRSYRRQDDNGIMPDLWSVHLCGNCKSLYLNPRPDRKSLPEAYTNYHTHSAHTTEPVLTSKRVVWALVRDYLYWRFGMVSALPTLYGGRWLFRGLAPLRQKLERFGRHLDRQKFPTRGNLLDVGCGNGTFLLLAKTMGWRVEGVEPDLKAVAVCRALGLEVISGELWQLGAERDATYDTITMNQVIEHVLEPRDVLAKCLQLLRPGGMLWLGLPNPRSFGLKFFRESWSALHPPYHLQMPTQEQLKTWLTDAGFDGVKIIRRGGHAKANWRDSLLIARREGTLLPPAMIRELCRLCADVISIITPRWGEETVIIAYRPQHESA